MLWLRSMVVLLVLGAATAGVYAASPRTTDWKLYRSDSFGFEVGKQFTIFTLLNETDVFQITIRQPSTESQLDPTYEAIISSVRFVN